MSDEQNVQSEEGAQQKQLQLRDTGEKTQYTNFFTVTGGLEALVLSFGTQFGRPDVAQIEGKVAMSWRNAKRLAVSLGAVIRRFEQDHGEIDIRPPQVQSSAGDSPNQ